MWEGGIKGIGSIRIPGVSPKQTRTQLMHVSDIMPTMLKLTSCPVAKKDQLKFDGNDQSEMLLHDKESPTEEFLINIDPLIVRPSKTDKRKWKSSFDVVQFVISMFAYVVMTKTAKIMTKNDYRNYSSS